MGIFTIALRHIAAPLVRRDSGRIRPHEFLPPRRPDRTFASAQIDTAALRRHPCAMRDTDTGSPFSQYGFRLAADAGCSMFADFGERADLVAAFIRSACRQSGVVSAIEYRRA